MCTPLVPNSVLGAVSASFVVLLVSNAIGPVKRSSKVTQRLVAAGTAVTFVAASVFIFYPPMECAKFVARRTKNLSHVRQMTLATLMYAADHDDHAPLASNWLSAIEPYGKEAGVKQVSAAHPTVDFDDWLEFNSPIFGAGYSELVDPAGTTMIAGGASRRPPGEVGVIVGFCDGHARWVSDERFSWGDRVSIFGEQDSEELTPNEVP